MKEDWIRIEDYKRYLIEYSIPWWERKSLDVKDKYNSNKQRYESNWFIKLLKWKFEDSAEVRFGRWDFHEDKIKARKNEILRCSYFEKLGKTHIQSALNVHGGFYQWCDDNKIPY